jgi:hypothetical protein
MSVLMQKDANGWHLSGILPSAAGQKVDRPHRELVRDDGATQIYRWEGLSLPLTPDACDDYWYNITSKQPCLYLICQPDAEGEPVPLRVSADQDDAVAAEEVDEWFFQAAMPKPILLWLKDYIATHRRAGPRKQKIEGKAGDKYRQSPDRRR